MTTVFISGSREIPYLPEQARDRIDHIMERELDVVIGDSERGVDARVIEYLASHGYEHVTVYTVHDRPRARGVLDTWGICKVTPTIEKKVGSDGKVRNARELETAKDEAMGEVADYGLVIWKCAFRNRFGRESASKGSLRNMYHLTTQQKPVVLYMLEEGSSTEITFSHVVLRDVQDLERVVGTCPAVVSKAFHEIAKSKKRSLPAEARLFAP